MRFSFDMAMAVSIAQGAMQDIFETPGLAWCMICSKPGSVSARYNPCPECGSHQLQVTGGSEM
jgi:hydrogenase nickel incorporation protein HypA/HybF